MTNNPPIPLNSLPIPPHLLATLEDANFRTSQDVLPLSASNLSKELHIPVQQAFQITQIVKQGVMNDGGAPLAANQGAHSLSFPGNGTPSLPTTQTQENYERITMSTGSSHFDSLLGGRGVVSGSLTELCGSYAVGKTTLLMQCAVMATLPKFCGGLDSKSLYIDTEGAFSKWKMTAVVRNLRRTMMERYPSRASEIPSQKQIFDRILFYRAKSLSELLACISLLEPSIDMEGYSLLIIDSITDHFRHTIKGPNRSSVLYSIADQLKSLSRKKSCCVLVSNQVRTQIKPGQQSKEIPSLGDKWTHAISCRIMMFKNRSGNGFTAQLYKSIQAEQQSKPYGLNDSCSMIIDVNPDSEQERSEGVVGEKRKRSDW